MFLFLNIRYSVEWIPNTLITPIRKQWRRLTLLLLRRRFIVSFIRASSLSFEILTFSPSIVKNYARSSDSKKIVKIDDCYILKSLITNTSTNLILINSNWYSIIYFVCTGDPIHSGRLTKLINFNCKTIWQRRRFISNSLIRTESADLFAFPATAVASPTKSENSMKGNSYKSSVHHPI